MGEPKLQYENQVQFSIEAMQALRDSAEPASENDVVQIFEAPEGNLIAVALGFRNLGLYIGFVMNFGAPVGFGKVAYTINGTAFVHFALYPLPPVEISSENGIKLDEF